MRESSRNRRSVDVGIAGAQTPIDRDAIVEREARPLPRATCPARRRRRRRSRRPRRRRPSASMTTAPQLGAKPRDADAAEISTPSRAMALIDDSRRVSAGVARCSTRGAASTTTTAQPRSRALAASSRPMKPPPTIAIARAGPQALAQAPARPRRCAASAPVRRPAASGAEAARRSRARACRSAAPARRPDASARSARSIAVAATPAIDSTPSSPSRRASAIAGSAGGCVRDDSRLRQRRPLVGRVTLFADERQRAVDSPARAKRSRRARRLPRRRR